MTHTNHRQGTIESLRSDWVVMMRTERGINDYDCNPKLQDFLHLSRKYDPVNAGTSKIGTVLTLGWQRFIDYIDKNQQDVSPVHVVFNNANKLAMFLHDLVKADLGLSVIVSGFHTDIDRMCREAGTKRHTVQYSLGVWGKTELLPHPKILEITTMCGHGMVPFSLVRRMSNAVEKGSLNLEQAAEELAKPCLCGIFNTKRAQVLIQEYISCAACK